MYVDIEKAFLMLLSFGIQKYLHSVTISYTFPSIITPIYHIDTVSAKTSISKWIR